MPVARLFCLRLIALALACFSPLAPLAAADDQPVAIHPENSKYFLFRGKPLVLITATEHYGSVINRPFDYRKYLDDMVDKRMTLTRTFLLYRELQTPRNPSSPCKPESPDFITPWPRTGPGKAQDGEPIYDLSVWNAEYFDRLRDFLSEASNRDIVVELTLFSHQYRDYIWALNPLHSANNKQHIGKVPWYVFDSLRDKALVAEQERYVRKIIEETSGFDNVYYEICNEPAGDARGSDVTTAEVDAWLEHMARLVRSELDKRGRKHLIFGAQAFNAGKLVQTFEKSFSGTWDAVNVHPSDYDELDGRLYVLGGFMKKDLTLKAMHDFCTAIYERPKPVIMDEDNAASMYRDPVGWTIHRKRAWTTVLCGGHYDYIDFSIVVGSEAGLPGASEGIRSWMKHLSTFIHSFDFVNANPSTNWLAGLPEVVQVSGLVVPDRDYIAYLADRRELNEMGAGMPVRGRVTLKLPRGRYVARFYSPSSGGYSAGVEVGPAATLELPEFRDDLVVRIERQQEKADDRTQASASYGGRD